MTPGDKSRRLPITWIVTTLIAVSLGAIGIWQAEKARTASEPRPARLEVSDFGVTDARLGLGGQKLSMRLRNRGDEMAVIDRARLRVLDKGVVRLCWVQGGGGGPIEVDRYDAYVSGRTAVGTVVPVDLDYALDGDDARRIEIHVTSPRREQRYLGVGAKRAIYQLDVELVTAESNRTISVGKAVVALPFPPYGAGFHWTSDLRSPERIQSTFGHAGFPFEALPCWRRNADTLARMLDLPGARDAQLRELARDVTQPWD